MEKLIISAIVISAILLFILPSCAQSPEQLFRQANEMYRGENYDEALKLYNQILLEGWESGELYYNLGSTYFKSGKLGLAVLFYEKARRLLPNDDDLKSNLEMARNRAADRIEVPRLAVWKYYKSLIDSIAINSAAVFTLIFYLCAMFLLALYIFQSRGGLKRLFFYTIIPFILLFLTFGSIFTVKIWRAEHIDEGVILVDKVEALSAPDEGSTGLFSIHEGLKVRLKQRLQSWVEIELPDGKKGWVKMETIGEI
ncbi:tetratricopeptide repeat protein [bacterium]|nr:tetratricopeptide repeat protein [bacterium]